MIMRGPKKKCQKCPKKVSQKVSQKLSKKGGWHCLAFSLLELELELELDLELELELDERVTQCMRVDETIRGRF